MRVCINKNIQYVSMIYFTDNICIETCGADLVFLSHHVDGHGGKWSVMVGKIWGT